MARRNQSMAEDIIDITAKFPWWVGVILAAISYFGLHSVASKGMPHGSPGDLSTTIRTGLFYTLAALGQYALPFVFGIGAVGSIIGTVRRKKLHSDVSSGNKMVADISWQEFELLIGEYFRRQGFSVQETGSGADGGIDLILKKEFATYVVQCKHYKVYKVGVKPVRELLGVMASCGAAGGYVVTSGQFTGDAISFARSNNIDLIDGKALRKILRATPKPSRQPQTSPIDPIPTNNNVRKDNSPVCPKCGNPLVVRVARKGSRAGQKFWGCTKFPDCRFTKPVD